MPIACQTAVKNTKSEAETDTLLRLKVDSQLLNIIRERKTGKIENASPALLQEDSTGTVRLEIKAKVSEKLMEFLRASGASGLRYFNQFDMLQCGLPLASIEKTAMRKDVDFVRPAPMMQLDREPK